MLQVSPTGLRDDSGQDVEHGAGDLVFTQATHPYTQASDRRRAKNDPCADPPGSTHRDADRISGLVPDPPGVLSTVGHINAVDGVSIELSRADLASSRVGSGRPRLSLAPSCGLISSRCPVVFLAIICSSSNQVHRPFRPQHANRVPGPFRVAVGRAVGLRISSMKCLVHHPGWAPPCRKPSASSG